MIWLNSFSAWKPLLKTYIVSYGTGIGVSNPGHLPLPRAHIRSRHIHTRACWQQWKQLLRITHRQLFSIIIPLGTVQALAEKNCFPVYYANNIFFWTHCRFRCCITPFYNIIKTPNLYLIKGEGHFVNKKSEQDSVSKVVWGFLQGGCYLGMISIDWILCIRISFLLLGEFKYWR